MIHGSKLDKWFAEPGDTGNARGELDAIRKSAQDFAQVILETTPACSDQSVAIRLVREAAMWAEEAIVRNL